MTVFTAYQRDSLAAEERVLLSFPGDQVVILAEDCAELLVTLDRGEALAVAERMIQLARQLEEEPRVLRRFALVDEELQEREM